MRYFLIILLGLISFLSSAQDVVIPAETARYFLEQDDRAKLLAEKDSVNQRIICGIKEELMIKDSIINSYKRDSMIYKSIMSNKDLLVSLGKKELAASERMINNQKFEVSLFAGAAAGGIIGSAIPAVGTVGGAVIGGITGCAVFGIHKIKELFKHK